MSELHDMSGDPSLGGSTLQPEAQGVEPSNASDHSTIIPGPPSLEYNLRHRKRAIIYFWTLVVVDSVAMPIVLYFTLWYKTNLSPNTVFSIVTAALGGISIFEYALRFWHLWKHSSTCRVVGARRAYLDWFHWCFSFMWFIIIAELVM